MWLPSRRLAWLQHHVARELGLPVGRLLMVVKPARVYQTESGYVRGVLAQSKRRALG
jgi:thymidylate synthase